MVFLELLGEVGDFLLGLRQRALHHGFLIVGARQLRVKARAFPQFLLGGTRRIGGEGWFPAAKTARMRAEKIVRFMDQFPLTSTWSVSAFSGGPATWLEVIQRRPSATREPSASAPPKV